MLDDDTVDGLVQSTRYVYRGNDHEEFVDELRRGEIRGGEHTMYSGQFGGTPPRDAVGELVGELGWGSFNETDVAVTGGVTDTLAQTRRFNGPRRYSMILDAPAVPFEKVVYSYEWFNEHPGAYDHVLSTSDGEIRVTGRSGPQTGALYGTASDGMLAEYGRGLRVRHWGGKGELPGMEGSRFEDESEWVASQPSVDISDAIEGVVSVKEPLGIRVEYSQDKDMAPKDVDSYENVLAEVFEEYREPLPDDIPFYLLVVDDFRDYKNTSYGGWRTQDIIAAHNETGRVEPENVPAKFRGGASA